MALIDKASLLMVPSTYEAGKLYNVLPSGNRAPDSTDQNSGYDQTRADFDFDRGSNAAATRINSSGLIEKYRENLLLQSNNFGTTWSSINASETGGQSGYDGSNNAWVFTDNTATNIHSLAQYGKWTTSVCTGSIYVKAGSLSKFYVSNGSSSIGAFFNLSTGSVEGVIGAVIAQSITSVGSGWYHLSVTMQSAGTFLIGTYETFVGGDYDSTINYTGTSSNILIQSAQLETGLCSTEYLNSTSVTAKAGVLVDLPRINYDANGENGALLLEPSRQNVVTNSEYVSSSDYVVGNWTGTITTNTTETLSPEGVYNATKFVKAGASDRVYFHNSQPDGAYTGSIYLKAASGSENKTIEISIRRFGGGGGSTTKLVTITNEWQRFDVSASNLTGGTTTAMYISDFSSAGTATDFYSYGMQIEAGSYPSSYIPNHGTSGGVTRAADSCSVTGASDVIGQTEGTIFIEAEVDTIGDTTNLININHSTTAAVTLTQQSNKKLRFQVFGAAGNAFILDSAQPVSGMFKAAIVYKSGDSSLFVNGVESASSTATFTIGSAGLNEIFLGTDIAYYAEVNQNKTKQVALFNERLTNAELATLTTL